jgi:hypothetical protein
MSIRRSSLLIGVTLALVTAVVSRAQRPESRGGAAPPAVAAAESFLATLDQPQRAKANLDLNEKTRTVWSNLPTGTTMQVGATERNGLKLGDMTPVQQKAAQALLGTALSRGGVEKVMAIVDADQVLEDRSAATRQATSQVRFGRGEYYLAILGKPAAAGTWMLQFGGHHLAVNVTYAGSAAVLAPTHTGTQPATFTLAGRTVRPLGGENDKAFALINALNSEQQKQAILGFDVRNVVLGAGADGKTIAPEGVRAATFTPPQRTMLLDLAREWVGILDDAAAASKMKEIESGLADTYFAWAGPTTNGKGAYFRIQGPAVHIEYAPQGQPDNNIDHIHTIFRDPTNDYAAKAAR